MSLDRSRYGGTDRLTNIEAAIVALQAGGSGAATTYGTRALYSGNAVNIGNDVTATLTWDDLDFGSEILDRSAPASPTVLTSGIYSVTASVMANDYLTAGGVFLAALHMDADNEDAVCEQTSNDQNPSGGQAFSAVSSLACSYYVPAGGVLRVTVYNLDGAATRPFLLREAMVQRLS